MKIGGLSQYADADYLIACRTMYFRFLRLLAKLRKTHAKVVMIPLPSIDVWWQSHLIRPRAYSQFCLDNFGVVIDRDMVVTDPSASSAAMIATAALWKNEYKCEYVDPTPSATVVGKINEAEEAKLTAEQKAEALTKLVASLNERESKGELKILDEGNICLFIDWT
jgi:aryl carrier-like protein